MNRARTFTPGPLAAGVGRRGRAGISLLEVLIAVFVLSFGLLGVAMVIPAGQWQLREALKADRGSACGRAALREMKIRGWLNPLGWRTLNTASPPLGVSVTANDPMTGDPGIPYRSSFAFDPLLLRSAKDAGNAIGRHFPYREPTIAASSPQFVVMPRVSIGWGTNEIMPAALANRIMVWRDDLLFPVEKEGRPRQLVEWSNGETAAFPSLAGDGSSVTSSDSPVVAVNTGDFTWMATVTPLPDGPDFMQGGVPYSRVNRISRYEVSIVVFYKRKFYVPDATASPSDFTDINLVKERSVFAVLTGDGWGGGEVMLQSATEAWLDLKKNDWIMLKASDGITGRNVFRWYRVVGVDGQVLDLDTSDVVQPVAMPVPAGDTSGYGRYVTLAGPDWRVDQNGDGAVELGFDNSSNPTVPNPDWAEAAIVEDVAGVYTTVVEIGSGSAWSP